ncbi:MULTISPECIES: hypothetical protein [unclassified Bradyrhizobium]
MDGAKNADLLEYVAMTRSRASARSNIAFWIAMQRRYKLRQEGERLRSLMKMEAAPRATSGGDEISDKVV